MELEELTQQIPKPLIAAIVILLGIAFIIVISPPHTVCQTYQENITDSFKGILSPIKENKKEIPAAVHRTRNMCKQGNSAGSCYEYFGILKKVAQSVKNAPSECYAELGDIGFSKYKEKIEEDERGEVVSIEFANGKLLDVLKDGIEQMALLAWGDHIPDVGGDRYGWMQESELAVFCHLKDAYSRIKSEDDWRILRTSIIQKFPGERPPTTDSAILSKQLTKKAIESYREQEILTRSIFYINCGNYR